MMLKKSMVKISIRLIVVWLLVSLFFFIFGEAILQLLLPYMTWLVNLMANNFHVELKIFDGQFIMSAIATQDVYRFNIPIAPKNTRIPANASVLHALVPIVILCTILLSWPNSFKKTIASMGFGLISSFILLSVTTPFLLVSHVERVFFTAAQNYAGTALSPPLIMNWIVFMEIGGVWLLPIIFAFLCVKIGFKV
jgi:hypothetical protein